MLPSLISMETMHIYCYIGCLKDVFDFIISKSIENKTCISSYYTHLHVLFPVISLFLPIIMSKKSFNPLLPIGNYSYRIIKISFSNKEGIKKKISYERRVYESVDEESLSWASSQNLTA